MDHNNNLSEENALTILVLETQVADMFTFLQRDKGFTKRLLTRKKTSHTTFIYRSGSLGIEIRLNYYSHFVDVWLVRLLDQGKYPENIKVSAGVLIKPRLEQVMRKQLNITDTDLDEVEHLRHDSESPQRYLQFMQQMLFSYHRLLQRHIDTILQEPLTVPFPTGIVVQPMGLSIVRHTLEQQALDRFAFLSEEKGFRFKLLKDIDKWWTTFLFRSTAIGVSVHFDYFDRLIEMSLVKLQNSTPPDSWITIWEQGVRVRYPLVAIISEVLGKQDPLIGEIRRAFNNTDNEEIDLDFCTAILIKYQLLLLRYIDDILQQPSEVLFPHQNLGNGEKNA